MRLLLLWGVAALALVGNLQAEEMCFYGKEDGSIVQVRSRADIPAQYLVTAKCVALKAPKSDMPAPEQVKLTGSVGAVQLSTAVGAIHLRWPRAVTELFGRTPERAMADAAMAVSRALQTGYFSTAAQSVNQTWSIVFMDERYPEPGIPSALTNSCHPGWMTPPSNIYIVAQKAATFCSGAKVAPSEADGRLATILVHEMGHAIEYQLLPTQFNHNRMRAEGFASWFEQYASGYSSVISPGQITKYYENLAKTSLSYQPGAWSFSGSAEDYARASMFFNAIVARRGVAGLMDVYKLMERSQLDFIPAIGQEIGWDERKLNEEVARVVR